MKKILKIILISLVIVIVSGIILSTIRYNSYWAKDPEYKVINKYLGYYHETYDECRNAFREGTQQFIRNFDSVESGKFLVDSKIDKDLTIDWCYIPPLKKEEKLLVITSGLHGIEGYTGSAVQDMYMKEIMNYQPFEDVGVLFIHGMNPFGFKYRRKVTENNVDLNRNCAIKSEVFESKNDGYKKLVSMLMPEGKLNLKSLRNRIFHLTAIKKIIQESMPVLRQAALQGQYDFEKGIYYGGKQYENQINQIKPFLKNILSKYNTVLNLDLHTGYGERAKLHLFLNPIEDEQVKTGIESIFSGVDIDWGNNSDFYTVKGEFIGWANSLPENVLCLPMLFEYGTLDSQTTYGSLKSIQIMINENQGYQYGYKNLKNEEQIKKMFSEMYYPESAVWRSKVMNDSYIMMQKMTENFKKLKPE